MSFSTTGHLHQEATTSSTALFHHLQYKNTNTSEIEEETDDLFSIKIGEKIETIKEELEGSTFSLDIRSRTPGEDCVYVAVGKSETSADAVSWTLKNLIRNESTMVYLIHIFPEIRHVPSPLGKLPKNQVSPEQVEIYMAQERGKRRELLQKFINMCSASKVKVDTILIESDVVAKAILELIPILNIRKLVLGTTKSNLRKMKARKGNGIADRIFQNASEFCDIKIICDGKEVIEQMIGLASPSSHGEIGDAKSIELLDQPNNNDSFSCMCFKSRRIM
ncbi:hypothetical protein JCGZ_08962 [Jatropha curcas]|uniref:UspA domain-containing protein n=1 Tax=Jatropha curcas TaxID=180498 RepID=A0A067KUJ6_JATCU|nr:U-box domain-containing protein 35 [Jatropha curcas]KDP35524.1 hypothetical protein JCGZ_08962 [Jatropha curcas]